MARATGDTQLRLPVRIPAVDIHAFFSLDKEFRQREQIYDTFLRY